MGYIKPILVIGLFIILNQRAIAFQPDITPLNWNSLSDQYLVRHYLVEDGLPINAVNYVAHHTDGFLYAATYDGLSQFDGNRFVNINSFTHPELQNNRLSWVGSGANDELWIIDAASNLYVYKNGEIAWLQGQDSYSHLEVYKVAAFNDNQVLITTNDGLLIQSAPGLNFESLRYEATQRQIKNSFTVAKNTVYFLLSDGLYRIQNNQIEKLLNADKLKLSPDEAFNLIITRDQSIWLLSRSGDLLQISRENEQHLYLNNRNQEIQIWDMIELNHDILLISSSIGYITFDRNSGIFGLKNNSENGEQYFEDNAWNNVDINSQLITKRGNQVFINDKVVLETSKIIQYLTIDKNGNIWVATNGDGIYQIVQKKMILMGDDEFPGLNNVYGMYEDKDGIWTVSFENQVFRLENEQMLNWNLQNSSIQNTYFRSVTSYNNSIFAGSFTLYKFEDNSWKIEPAWTKGDELIDVLFTDEQNRFWLGTDFGLYLYDGIRFNEFKDATGQTLFGVKSLQNYDEDHLLISSESQGLVVLTNDNRFQTITKNDGLSSNIIRDVFVASEDTLWVVTEDKGLNRLVITDDWQVRSVSSVTINDGLVDNSLHRLVEDGLGYFWINSNNGIMRIQERAVNDYLDGERDRLPVETFGEDDGLGNVEGNGGTQSAGLFTRDRKLLLPGQGGIFYTRPDWFVQNSTTKLIAPAFETLAFKDSVYALAGKSEFVLPKSDRSIQVKITMAELTYPDKMELYYKMDGVNEDWQPAGTDRTAILTNLPAGVNKLRIRGKLKGESLFRENEIAVIVPPFFYETTGFLVLILISLMGVFYGGFRILMNRSREREVKLNQLVQERTKQLLAEKEKTEEALLHIKKLDESKSRFFTNFTHELRTPLSLILNPLEDMLEEENVLKQGNRESLTLMRRNAMRLRELINQLLDVSKLNAGELSLKYELVKVKELTTSLADQFKLSLQRKNLNFSIEGDEYEGELYLDVNAWHHIISNILSNAIKFSKDNGSITIKIENVKEAVIVNITDTGLGIKSAELPYIFDTYYQGDSSVSKAEGTGIGLALVKGLVEQMGGVISVQSEVGIGSSFIIHLKTGTGHLNAEEIVTKKDSVSIKTAPVSDQNYMVNAEQQSEKILLVEDNDDYREYLQGVISREYHIEVAQNGVQGLEILNSFTPDLIVSDIMMPEMDGYEMMKSIRARQEFHSIPFIFLSAKDTPSDIEKGLNLGADIYLPKPIENRLLLTQIKALLRREQRISEIAEVDEPISEAPLVVDVKEIVRRHLGNPDLSVDMIAESLSMSSPTLYRKWKKVSEETINKLIGRLRFEEALKLIEEEDLTISEASYAVGFSHLSYFSNAFKKVYGVSPQEYISGK